MPNVVNTVQDKDFGSYSKLGSLSIKSPYDKSQSPLFLFKLNQVW